MIDALKNKFINRNEELKAFELIYGSLKNKENKTRAFQFYGEGGVGKTTLINKIIEEYFNNEDNSLKNSKYYLKHDFSDFESPNKELVKLRNKFMLIDKNIFNFLRFDLALLKLEEYKGVSFNKIDVSNSKYILETNPKLSLIIQIFKDFTAYSIYAKIIDLFNKLDVTMHNDVNNILKQISTKNIVNGTDYKINNMSDEELDMNLYSFFVEDLIEAVNKLNEPLVIFLENCEIIKNKADMWLFSLDDGIVKNIPNVLWVFTSKKDLNYNWKEMFLCENNDTNDCKYFLNNFSEENTHLFLEKYEIPKEYHHEIYKITDGYPLFLYISSEVYKNSISKNKKFDLYNINSIESLIRKRYLPILDKNEMELMYKLSVIGKWTEESIEETIMPNIKIYNTVISKKYLINKSEDEIYKFNDILRQIIYSIYQDKYDNLITEITRKFVKFYTNKINEYISFDKDYISYLHLFIDFYFLNYEYIDKKYLKKISDYIEKLKDKGSYSDYYYTKFKYYYKDYDIKKNIFGEKNSNTLESLSKLSLYYSNIGNYDQALKHGRKVYELSKTVLGETHLNTLTSLINLSTYYSDIGDYKQALKYGEKAYKLTKKVYGETHKYTLSSLSNLSNYYSISGDYNQALKYGKLVYELQKDILGDGHPDTLTSLSNLSVGYSEIGDYNLALKYGKKVYELRKNILGVNHPSTLKNLTILSTYYSDKGDYYRALEYGKQAYEQQKEVLSENHPSTLTSLNNLSICYSKICDYKEALKYGKLVYEKQKIILGESHPDTLGSLNNLSYYYFENGNYKQALKYGKQTYEQRKYILGESHPDSLTSLSNLSSYCLKLGKYNQALEYGKQAYEQRKYILGESHPDTLSSLNNLSDCYSENVDYKQAIKYGKQAYELQKKVLGENHPDTLSSLNNLSIYYSKIGDYKQVLMLI